MAEIARNIVSESEEDNYVLAENVETALKERLAAAMKEGKKESHVSLWSSLLNSLLNNWE